MSDKKIKTKLIKNGPEKEPLSFNKQTIFAGVAVVISIALFFVNNKFKCVFFQSSHNSSCEVFMSNAPKYCVYVHNNGNYILESLEKVVNLLGLERVEFLNGSEINEECDLFWTYNYPFVLNFTFKNLKYYQRLNHIPGNVGLASKSILGTTTNSKYIPKAFKNSADLQKYAEKYPEKRFVQKMRTNRGVELKKASEMNFTTSETDSKYFGQEFIENPLLFEGHKFDMGVFVVITSVNPLRFYYYNDNLNIRLCSRPYDYNNFDDLRTYVIDDAHITGGHFKTIKEYYDKSYSYKAAFNDYFTSKGYDMNKVWNQVEDCIRSVVVSRNKYFMDGVSYHNLYLLSNYFKQTVLF